jgi:predicted phosphoribosyltransferase
MFRNREEAARQPAQRLKHRVLHNLLVLAVPRGGVVVGISDPFGAKKRTSATKSSFARKRK